MTIHSNTEQQLLQEEEPQGVDIFSSPPDQADVDEFFRRFSDVHALLHSMVDYLKLNTFPKETSDLFEVVTLNKAGSGSNWIPSRFQRQYMRIAAPVPTAIQITSMLGTPFVVTVPAVAPPLFWNIWDWPDQSSFYLDATATANNMKVWVRFTNVA